MKHFSTILNHEIRMLLVSSSTYIAAVLLDRKSTRLNSSHLA